MYFTVAVFTVALVWPKKAKDKSKMVRNRKTNFPGSQGFLVNENRSFYFQNRFFYF